MFTGPLPHVKICGLRKEDDVSAAIDAGARWLGFVHFDKSPRHVDVGTANTLIAYARQKESKIETVLLLVNPTADEAVATANEMGVDHIQLHGNESNLDLQAIRAKRPNGEVWKALPVSTVEDLDQVKLYPAADRFLFDAKPPKDADRPGGWGESFDWSILRGFQCGKPWLLAGGLTPDNASEAARISGTKALDVSSGVEAEPGVKNAALIKAFVENATKAL